MKNSKSYQAYIKSPYRSIKHNTYFSVYDELFLKYRNKKIVFVEIGVLGGGSLFMWRKFFGNKARIIGVDMNPNARKWKDYGFEIIIGNQSDEKFWKKFISDIGPIDIVLDDGGHTYDQQIVTTEMLLENIKDGGILVVEDTHTSYMSGFGPKRYSFIEYTKNMIDLINNRFSKFNRKKSEKRVWSLRIFESIVAFSVNKRATKLISKPTVNSGEDDGARDFRHKDNTYINTLGALNKVMKFMPGYKLLNKFLNNIAVNQKFSSRKFFDN